MSDIPESFHRLEGFFLPDAFWPAFGYDPDSGARWVSIYWTPMGDEAEADDGRFAGTVDPWAYLTLVEHQRNKPLTSRYDFGSSDFEAVHWLLIDLDTGDVYAGLAEEVQNFVYHQWDHGNEPADPISLTASQWNDLAESVIAAFNEIGSASHEVLAERMEEQRQAMGELKKAMDEA